jgi:hypothetical protein
MMVGPLTANLEDIVVESSYEVSIRDGVLHEGLANRIDRASFIGNQHLERWRKVVWKDSE